MKHRDTSAPIVINRTAGPYVFAAFFLVEAAVFMLFSFFGTRTEDTLVCIAMAVLCAAIGVLPLITMRQMAITVTREGVTIDRRRDGYHAEHRWEDFRFLYTLYGYKTSAMLFSPVALTKQAQYDACDACMRAKDTLFAHDGCLALRPCQQAVLDRLPEHIHIAPEYECGTLYNKGKGH